MAETLKLINNALAWGFGKSFRMYTITSHCNFFFQSTQPPSEGLVTFAVILISTLRG